MNVINNNKNLSSLKRGMKFKNYHNKNKYFFNELYKNETMPKEDLVNVVNQILNDEGQEENDQKIKNITQEFVKDHHELFASKNDDENHVKNDDENLVEKIDEIKHEVEIIEEIKDEHPNYKHIEHFNDKIEKLKEDINKKFEDMIDSHLELKKSINEKRAISDSDAKVRIENIEDKMDMLYAEQTRKPVKKRMGNSKDEMMAKFINFKLNG